MDRPGTLSVRDVTGRTAAGGPVADQRLTWLLFGELLSDCFADAEVAGGAPFNVATHLAALGGPDDGTPVLVSRVGQDERGRFLLQRVREAGLGTDAIQRDRQHPSGCVDIRLAATGHAFVIPPDQAWDFIMVAPALAAIGNRRVPWLYFGTLAQRGQSRRALRTLVEHNGGGTFLDVNLREDPLPREVLVWSLAHADILKLNDDELQRLSRLLRIDPSDPRDAALRLMTRFDIRQVIVTAGAHGAWSVDRAGRSTEASGGAPLADFRDSVGAGDAFAAVCLFALARGWPVELMLRRANRFAREICRIRGAVPVDRAFYREFRAEFAAPVESVE